MESETTMNKTQVAKVHNRLTTPTLSVEERKAAGKALRTKVPHELHAEYKPAPQRADPVAILENAGRDAPRESDSHPLRPHAREPVCVPARFGGRDGGRFGAFTRDGHRRFRPVATCTSPTSGCSPRRSATWYSGSTISTRRCRAPWEWDLKRLAASAVVACRFMGADKVLCEEAARAAVRTYRKRMREYAEMGNMEVWYARIDEQDVLASLTPERET